MSIGDEPTTNPNDTDEPRLNVWFTCNSPECAQRPSVCLSPGRSAEEFIQCMTAGGWAFKLQREDMTQIESATCPACAAKNGREYESKHEAMDRLALEKTIAEFGGSARIDGWVDCGTKGCKSSLCRTGLDLGVFVQEARRRGWGMILAHGDTGALVGATCGECLSRARQATPAAPSGTPTTADLIASECDAIKEMLLSKNRKYGDSAIKPKRVFSKASAVEQILVRIDDKLSRIESAQDDEDEDVEKDLIGYLVLLRVARRSE